MELGMLEYEITFIEIATGKETKAVTTPSMWALADEWADRVRGRGGHTPAWVNAKMGQAIWLQAAQDAGLVDGDTIDLVQISEMMNRYEVEVSTSTETEAEDPTVTGQGDGLGAE